MVKRILDATATDFLKMNATDLAKSIQMTEGRTISAEVICTYEPPTEGVTLAEIAAAFGADIITLDYFDPDNPLIMGLPPEIAQKGDVLFQLKRLVGRPIAVNMAITKQSEGGWLYTRRYTPERLDKLVRQGADILFLYGDPQSGVTLDEMVSTIQHISSNYYERLLLVAIPDVYFPAPVSDKIKSVYKQAHEKLLSAGAHSIGLIMPGSKQAWRLEETGVLVDHVHALGGLVWLIMTHSVEGGPTDNIHQIALNAKMVGGDAYRLDEAGLYGMPLPENIFEFSLAIRGKRHTYRRMALSPLR
ncbi:hypothetical protein QYE77_14290 [Thermanaerothrix sp. 4228-RoL]|jgi:hypothetical protein|uniref:DUF7916 domain-containing protein n=1 Tax=Thermanaerothrix solaris TaxID=3058434 RepID=A0ABU3NRG7_9CHLR|nr:hypothetical protein [Thermanaerothrix sp. 4228-RoL]MDT8899430.1 hypothetical protein [Thermanaerothrix sp. 4228-RoL]